jgi:uncharacterized protein DUF6962
MSPRGYRTDMQLNPSPTELTTAATDALLGILCLTLLTRLRRLTASGLRKSVWAWVFRLLVLSSALGALAHGLVLSESVRAMSWHALYLSLDLAVALFFVGAVADWQGEAAARRLIPWAGGVGVAFWTLSRFSDGSFVVFVAYEALTMSAALAIYVFLAFGRHLAGADRISVGIGLSLVAAAIQASRLSLRAVVPFDHNGLFHVVQMSATIVIASGVRRTLQVVEGERQTGGKLSNVREAVRR